MIKHLCERPERRYFQEVAKQLLPLVKLDPRRTNNTINVLHSADVAAWIIKHVVVKKKPAIFNIIMNVFRVTRYYCVRVEKKTIFCNPLNLLMDVRTQNRDRNVRRLRFSRVFVLIPTVIRHIRTIVVESGGPTITTTNII